MTEDRNFERKPAIRIFLVRHGQPLQHAGKVFLGQTDVPLSEAGKLEAAAAGAKLLEYGAVPKRIYTSDLTRAKETAVIIAEKLGGLPLVSDILFREMAMGVWDGELIEDIKTKFPAEYEKRGNDLRNYRIPGGENFYELHSRVTREFYRIFTEDFICEDPGDFVIVAHLGVITVLSEELMIEYPEAPKHIATGSITFCEAPDWLRADRSPK